MRSVALAFRYTAELFSSHRKLWLPFILVAFVEILCLGVLWLAPQPPFSTLLAPPIRYFFGERVLHYPWHLWFLYHAMKHTHLIATIFLGAFMTGIVCVMVRQTYTAQPLSLHAALVSRQVRYGRMVWIWLMTWALAEGAVAGLTLIAPKATWLLWATIGVTVVLQALVVYAIPAAVFNASPWWRALPESVREAILHPVSTLVIVLIPSAIVLAWAVFVPSARVAAWMMRTEPEIALAFVAGRLLVLTAADAFLTVGAAHLWWIHRAPELAASATAIRSAAVSPIPPSRHHTVQTGTFAVSGVRVTRFLLLMAASGALVVTGCSANYKGERLFWKAQRLSRAVEQDMSHATPAQLQQVEEAYQLVIRSVPGTLWAGRAQSVIGLWRAQQHQYQRARDAYQLVLRNYDAYKELCVGALVSIGKTYEVEQRWDEAAAAYRQIVNYSPWSVIGLEVPLYLARMQEQRHAPEQATAAYAEAVSGYQTLIKKAPSPELAVRVKGYLALAYQRLKDWPHAVEILNELASAKEGINRPVVLMGLGTIYQTRLGDTAKADAIYTQLMTEFPQHPLGKAARFRHEQLTRPLSAPAPQAQGTTSLVPEMPSSP